MKGDAVFGAAAIVQLAKLNFAFSLVKTSPDTALNRKRNSLYLIGQGRVQKGRENLVPFKLCNINHQQCWWDQKALAMHRKRNPPLV